MKDLTDKQRRVLDYIKAHIAENLRPPTSREIQKHFGWKSQNSAMVNIRVLRQKGYVVGGNGVGSPIPVMKQCKCGSHAINPGHNDRDDEYPDLCDICYWKQRHDNELHDVQILASHLGVIYDYASGGLVSKPFTDPHAVIEISQAREQRAIDDAVSEVEAYLKGDLV